MLQCILWKRKINSLMGYLTEEILELPPRDYLVLKTAFTHGLRVVHSHKMMGLHIFAKWCGFSDL